MPFFKTCRPNEHGDDFVVGDLHGHRQALMDELARQGFDPEKDRLFCTGDLIDRGPDSFGTLGLIFEPWFHFVRGNHEDDLPDFINFEFSRFPGWRPSYCDQEWLYSLHETQVHYLVEKVLPRLADAPVVLRVEGPYRFTMVHADRSEFGGYQNPVALLDDYALPFASGDNQLEVLLWSRRLLKQIPHADLIDRGLFQAVEHHELAPNVGLTFVGHSIVERPMLYRSHLFIDTGAGTVPEGRLTVLRVKDVLDRILIDSTIKQFSPALKALADEDGEDGKWHIGGQHPLGPYVHDFKARSLKPAQPVSIEEMNEAIARQGAKAGGSYLEKASPFYRWGKTAEVKFGNEDFDDLPEKDWLRMAAISAGVRYTNPPTKEQLGEMLATGHVQIQWETHVRQVIEEFPSIGFAGLIQQVAQTHGLSPEQVAGNIEKLARELHCDRIGKRVGT